MRRTLTAAVLAATAALTLGACSAGVAGTASPPPAAAPEVAAPAAPVPALAGIGIVAQQAPELGTIVADTDGFTLYRFDKDSPKPPTATCVADCAAKWPPLIVDPEGQLTIDGVEQSAIGMVQRPDGQSQLTIGGWPVYTFAGDTDPGSTKGQGVGGTWFAVTPEGKKAPQ